MIVAERRNKKSCDREDWYILSRKHPDNTQITYILSLGVFKEYRRLGVGERGFYFLNFKFDTKINDFFSLNNHV